MNDEQLLAKAGGVAVPQAIIDYHKRLDAAQTPIIRQIGDAIGYGRLMQLAQNVWREKLKEQGLEGGEFRHGPCVALTVDCPHPTLEENGHCELCCGAGWTTPYALKQAERIKELEGIGKEILYHDERGQGVGFAEAMNRLKQALEKTNDN